VSRSCAFSGNEEGECAYQVAIPLNSVHTRLRAEALKLEEELAKTRPQVAVQEVSDVQ